MWELAQRPAIEETLLDYCELVDRNDVDTLVTTVFTEDASFELGSRHAITGRENLRAMFTKTLQTFQRTSHHLSNLRITFTGEGSAQTSAYVYAWHALRARR